MAFMTALQIYKFSSIDQFFFPEVFLPKHGYETVAVHSYEERASHAIVNWVQYATDKEIRVQP